LAAAVVVLEATAETLLVLVLLLLVVATADGLLVFIQIQYRRLEMVVQAAVVKEEAALHHLLAQAYQDKEIMVVEVRLAVLMAAAVVVKVRPVLEDIIHIQVVMLVLVVLAELGL
jgi:uncharacterized protein HemX